jgi:hypothetical protein
MSTEIMKIKRMTDDEIVFHNPEDIAKFYELLVDQGQAIILKYTDESQERSIFVRPEDSIKVTKGTLKLRSERPV